MNPNLKRILLTAALASAAVASPAWAQVTANTTTTIPGANTPGSNDAGVQARLRAECYDETTRSLRTTANCTGLTVDGSGMISGSAASAPAPYPSVPKATASTQQPKSLKEQSSGSTSGNSTGNSTGSSSTNGSTDNTSSSSNLSGSSTSSTSSTSSMGR